jgi:hypothetical protein
LTPARAKSAKAKAKAIKRNNTKVLHAIVDSGAFPNMCTSKSVLTNLRQPKGQMSEVETAGGRTMKVQVAGDLRVASPDHAEQSVLLGAALVPEGLQENLVSVGAFCDQREDNEVKFNATGCVFMESGKEVLVAKRNKGDSTYETVFNVPTANRFSALEVTDNEGKKEEERKGRAARETAGERGD